MRRLRLAPSSSPRLRCEPSAPECNSGTRSAHAVSHDYDGLLHTRGVGLLHPTANHEVRLVAGHPKILTPHRPPICRHLAVLAAERSAPITIRVSPRTCRLALASRSSRGRGQVRSVTGDRGCTPKMESTSGRAPRSPPTEAETSTVVAPKRRPGGQSTGSLHRLVTSHPALQSLLPAVASCPVRVRKSSPKGVFLRTDGAVDRSLRAAPTDLRVSQCRGPAS